jgi:hypothetical protein
METVNQESSAVATLSFTDVNGAVIPASNINTLLYQISDEKSGNVLLPWVSVVPNANPYTVSISSSVQQIVDPCEEYEIRIIAAIVTYNSNTQKATGTFKYRVKNLWRVFQDVEIDGSGGFVIGGSAGSI